MSKINMNSKHNHICDLIAEELTRRGWKVEENVIYYNGHDGEIDVIAYKEGYAIDVEVKYNDKPKAYKKACEQLDRAEIYYKPFKHKRLFKMYGYHTNTPKGYELQWVRK